MTSSVRVWLLAFVLVLAAGQSAVGMRASRTATVTGDEPFYLLTAQSLVSDGDLDLHDEYRSPRTEMARFWDGTKPLWKQMRPAPDGRLLSPHDPGLSLLITPAYAGGGLEGVRRFLVVVWAAAMACAALLGRRAGAPAWAAVVGAVVVGAGAPGVVYASQVYPEGPAALCIALALLAATAPPARSGGNNRGGARLLPPERWVSGFGVLLPLVALLWLGVKYLPYALVIAGVWAWRNRDAPAVVLGAGAVALAAGIHFTVWHLDTFGGLTPYSTNVVWSGEGTAEILVDHIGLPNRIYRLYGVFLDARFGLVRWLPAAALAVLGIARRTALHATVLAIAVVMATFVSITIMGYWFPGRMLAAAFPGLAVLVAIGVSRLPRTAVVLTAWSLAIAAAVVVAAKSGAIRLAVDPWTVGFPLPPAILFPDFRAFGPPEVARSLAWAAAAALLAFAGRFRPWKRPSRPILATTSDHQTSPA